MTDDRYRITGDVVLDTTTGLEWQREHSLPMTWQQAMDYAAKIGDGWRLPTVSELVTLVDYERHTPASAFPAMPVVAFWSSSSYAGSASYAWRVNFYGGYVYNDGKSSTYCVRCVRRRGALGASDLSAPAAGTIAINDCADLRAAHRRAHADAVAVLREVMDAEAWDDPGTKTHETVRSWLDDRGLVARADAVLAGRAWNDDGEVTR